MIIVFRPTTLMQCFFYVAMIIHAEHSENDDTQITLRLQEEKQVSRLSQCSYKLAENYLI